MDAKQILLGRLSSLDQDLEQAKERLESEPIPKALEKRLGNELYDSIDDLRAKLKDACKTGKALPEDSTPDAQSRLKTAWIGFDGLQVAGERLLVETLALIQGARSRSQSKQHALLAAIADDLIDELCKDLPDIAWKRFTFEAEGEAFAENTSVIRLRFPMTDIWNLPVAVHEFGHFLAGRLRVVEDSASRLPFQEYLTARTSGEKNKRWYYLNEFFADAVATYALGPAYGYTCLLARFNPVRAWSETDGLHPPDGHRAALILDMLDRMNQEPHDAEDDIDGARTRLEEFWSGSLTACGRAPDVPEKDAAAIHELAGDIYDKMLKPGARHLRYKSLGKAREKQTFLKDGAAGDPGAFALTDLLNAAWRQRLTPGVDPDTLNSSFLSLWEARAGQWREARGEATTG